MVTSTVRRLSATAVSNTSISIPSTDAGPGWPTWFQTEFDPAERERRLAHDTTAVLVAREVGGNPHRASTGRLDQRLEHELGAQMIGHRPAHDPAAARVDHDREEQESGPGRHVGDVGDPELVGCIGLESTLDEVRWGVSLNAMCDAVAKTVMEMFHTRSAGEANAEDLARLKRTVEAQFGQAVVACRHLVPCTILPGSARSIEFGPVRFFSSIRARSEMLRSRRDQGWG